ncbi:MAG: hypothetical protein GF384_00245, partial [Elusimicrobia bacterium]|nr:hypothetical protein [Elusimicrobiota bacterium]MBD3411526.1 hypothetical protein [Elusimicrobiota bacterium]
LLKKEIEEQKDALIRNEEILDSEKQTVISEQRRMESWRTQKDQEIKLLAQQLADERNKPKFEPQPGSVRPLVKEALSEPILLALVESWYARITGYLEPFAATLPQKQASDFHELLKHIEHDRDALRDDIQPITISIQLSAIHLIVDEALNRFTDEFTKRSITLKKQYTADIPHIKLDPRVALRVMVLLFQNACDAMPEGGNLTLAIETVKQTVVVKCEDTGHGIKKQDMSRIYNPFFTTRANKMGLGLYLARLYMHAMQGEILIESTPGKKTHVQCIFPVPNH